MGRAHDEPELCHRYTDIVIRVTVGVAQVDAGSSRKQECAHQQRSRHHQLRDVGASRCRSTKTRLWRRNRLATARR
jgi:hypothetical protein